MYACRAEEQRRNAGLSAPERRAISTAPLQPPASPRPERVLSAGLLLLVDVHRAARLALPVRLVRIRVALTVGRDRVGPGPRCLAVYRCSEHERAVVHLRLGYRVGARRAADDVGVHLSVEARHVFPERGVALRVRTFIVHVEESTSPVLVNARLALRRPRLGLGFRDVQLPRPDYGLESLRARGGYEGA